MTALTHTWYLSGRRLHAVLRQPGLVLGNLIQLVIWLFLFGELFKRVVQIPVSAVFGTLSNTAGMLLRQREAIIGIYIMFMLPLTFLSTAFMPGRLMPDWIRHIAGGNPLNWAVEAGRGALSADPDWAGVLARCGGLFALAVVCVAVSVATFRSYHKSV